MAKKPTQTVQDPIVVTVIDALQRDGIDIAAGDQIELPADEAEKLRALGVVEIAAQSAA